MPEIPPPANPKIDTVDGIIHGIIFGVAVNAAYGYAVAQMPWLGFPIISTVFRYLLNKFAGMIYDPLKASVNFKIIETDNLAQKKEYDASIAALTQAHDKGDKDEIEKAKQAAADALARLVKFGGH